MHPDETLIRLADEAGIEPRYWDIQGRLHEATSETLRALLEALGIPAQTNAEAAASLSRLIAEPWRSVLAPVIVAREHGEIDVPFRLPAAETARTIRWRIRLETGEIEVGEAALADMPVEETGTVDGAPINLRRLRLPPLPPGYHEFHMEASGEAATTLIVAPLRCHLPAKFASARCWGLTTQLYSLNTQANWGMGDFGDIRMLIENTAPLGVDAIGLNPLHALFLDTPEQASPYSPNSRLFRNPLYLDPSSMPDFSESSEARALFDMPDMIRALSIARDGPLVNYKAVAALKLALLQLMRRSFEEKHLSEENGRGQEYRNYVERAEEALERFATYQALAEHLGTHDWRQWPDGYRDCASREVRVFQEAQSGRISFFKYLQWLCEEAFSGAAKLARARGMAVGLCNDLAISVDASSADHWANRDLFAGQARVGAPPDPFNELGQEWGVVPLIPHRLKATGYAHFIALLRANMRHAGALRIDHIMGWQRLFMIPAGASPADGAYVRFPLDELMAIAALESQRNECLIIGEDLGTVPAGFRERMSGANMLSCRVLYFERGHDRFHQPEEYPALASVSASTHDLATLHGFWTGDDIAAKAQLGALATAEEEARARAERAHDKRLLLQALADEGLLPQGADPSDADRTAWSPELGSALHLYLARTPACLVMVQLDDLAGEEHQANLPGSTTQYPNWRRRLSRDLSELLNDPAIRCQMEEITAERARRL
ncbi:MAG: 4-alpha-glucanotransferase [Parvibaculum sp.]|uniref:4-alpha-glucanotransferase n=1 Tax=Parvibaculum sp. TaxID=2024848 RepID=UPI003C723091